MESWKDYFLNVNKFEREVLSPTFKVWPIHADSSLSRALSTLPKAYDHTPLALPTITLSDLFILLGNSNLRFDSPLGKFGHSLIGSIHVQEFYQFLSSTYYIVTQGLLHFLWIDGWLPITDSASTTAISESMWQNNQWFEDVKPGISVIGCSSHWYWGKSWWKILRKLQQPG